MNESAKRGALIDGFGASWTHHVSKSPMQDALSSLARPGTISFALGLPSPELFPIEEFTNACAKVFTRGSRILQYGEPSKELRSHVVSLMRTRGVECTEQQIVLTSGAQQALHFIVKLLLDDGQKIIAEELSYPGFQQIIKFYKPELLTIPTDPDTGMDVDRIEWYLASGERPAFIYSIPDGHNPLGVTLSEEKRRKLLALSGEYHVPIIEEDPYGLLSYGATPLNPMRSQGSDLVFYVGSFSKIIAPSVRLGWLVVPEELTPHFAILKESSDIDMATFSQHVVARMLDSGFLPQHLSRLRMEYKCRRDVMLSALATRFPVGSEWTKPDSGVFIWVRLPHGVDTAQLATIAVQEHGVAYMPGSVFCTKHGSSCASTSMRLNFSHPSLTSIEEGMLHLGQMFGSSDALMHRRGSPNCFEIAREL